MRQRIWEVFGPCTPAWPCKSLLLTLQVLSHPLNEVIFPACYLESIGLKVELQVVHFELPQRPSSCKRLCTGRATIISRTIMCLVKCNAPVPKCLTIAEMQMRPHQPGPHGIDSVQLSEAPPEYRQVPMKAVRLDGGKIIAHCIVVLLKSLLCA